MSRNKPLLIQNTPLYFSFSEIATVLKGNPEDPTDSSGDAMKRRRKLLYLRLGICIVFISANIAFYGFLSQKYWFGAFRYILLSAWILLFPVISYYVVDYKKLILSSCITNKSPKIPKIFSFVSSIFTILPLLIVPILFCCRSVILAAAPDNLDFILSAMIYLETGLKYVAGAGSLLFFCLTVLSGSQYFLPLCGSGVLLATAFQWNEIHTWNLTVQNSDKLLIIIWVFGLLSMIIGKAICIFTRKRVEKFMEKYVASYKSPHSL